MSILNKEKDLNLNVVRLSKKLSKVLRHSAKDLGIHINSQGYVKVSDLLCHPQFHRISFSTLQTVVANNNKNRFSLLLINNEWMIKANQGHSISTVTELEGIPLIDPTLPVIHATSSKCLPSILKEGLKPMRRLHIHFAEPGPLLRNTCDIHIYINMEACLRDHIEFLKAPNGVIFSSGIHGVLPPKYFLKIVPALPS